MTDSHPMAPNLQMFGGSSPEMRAPREYLEQEALAALAADGKTSGLWIVTFGSMATTIEPWADGEAAGEQAT